MACFSATRFHIILALVPFLTKAQSPWVQNYLKFNVFTYVMVLTDFGNA
jgi:hypothetical protein